MVSASSGASTLQDTENPATTRAAAASGLGTLARARAQFARAARFDRCAGTIDLGMEC